MWFKNIQLYQFTQPFSLSAEDISQKLEAHEFAPCHSQQPSSSGWTPPLGRQGNDFVHAANGYIMLCSKTQEKLLPAAVVNEELEEKVIEIEESQSRKVSRKERTSLKEEIVFNLLPMAFARSRVEFAYIALNEGLLVLNTSSEKKADEMVSSLRKALGALPVVPLECNSDPVEIMTDWVNTSKTSNGFELGEECELHFETDSARIIRCKNQDLGSTEILGHLKAGMRVSKLALSWQERLEFVLDDKLMIKRIRFTDVFQESLKENSESADDKASQFDIDFSIMTLEHAGFFAAMIKALGGIRKNDTKEKESTDPDTSANPQVVETEKKADTELESA